MKKIRCSLLFVVALLFSFGLSSINPALAAIVGEDYSYKSVNGYTLSGALLINRGDSTPYPVSAYAQTYMAGFLQGTAPVDSLTVSIVACVETNCSAKKTVTANIGSNSPSVTISLGNMNGSAIYSATGYHSAKKSGITYNASNTYTYW